MRKGWETAKLGAVCELIARGVAPKYLEDGGIRVLNQRCVRDHTIDYSFARRHDVTAKAVNGERLIKSGDVLVNSTGTGTLGRVAQVRNKPLEATTVDTHVTIVRPMPGKFFAEFFGYTLIAIENEIAASGEGASGQTELARGTLENKFEILFPSSLLEQQRIVGILDQAFEAIATAKANTEKNLKNARAIFESHRQTVFAQRGKEWADTTVDQISTNLDNKRVPITKNVRTSGKYPYYGASGIVDYVGEYIFDGDTLLISEDGANLLARSSPIAFSVSGKYWVNNHAHILKFQNMATQRFVEFYLESIMLDEYITGAAQPKLNQKALNSIPIPIPRSIEAQAEIVGSFESLQRETQNLAKLYEQKLTSLEELKKSLLNQAFTGEL
jgi:type I restriction enzyme S subunit